MIKYKCPKCGASCNTSHCYDCDKDIPFSCKFDDGSSNVEEETTTVGYRCPTCGATCRTPYCYDCDRDLPMRKVSGWHANHALPIKPQPSDYAKNIIDTLLWVDNSTKKFKINGSNTYPFSDLISYELYENNSVIQESGVDRAIIGGLLFGDVGAIVGAQTRGMQSVVDTLYIRISLKSGMHRINLIGSPTSRSEVYYNRARKNADEIMAKLDQIAAENQKIADEAERQENQAVSSSPVSQPTQTDNSPTLIADELLKLKQLLDMGVLTDEEFNQQKQKLLNR